MPKNIETNISYGGTSDIGYGRDYNEDYFDVATFGEDCLLMALADGMGSQPSELQPAAIAVTEIMRVMRTAFQQDTNAVLNNPRLFLQLAMGAANRVLAAFKLGNEERYSGFAASVTCCLIYNNTNICFAHCGNTRLHLIRFAGERQIIRQLTKDNTKAVKMLEDGIITPDQYPLHPDRLALTSAIGMVATPEIQYFNGSIKPEDLLLLTTKGIHFAIRPEPMSDIALRSGTCEDAAKSLIEAAKGQKYADNMTALLAFIPNLK